MTKQQKNYFWSAGCQDNLIQEILEEHADNLFNEVIVTSRGKIKEKDRNEAVKFYCYGFKGIKIK